MCKFLQVTLQTVAAFVCARIVRFLHSAPTRCLHFQAKFGSGSVLIRVFFVFSLYEVTNSILIPFLTLSDFFSSFNYLVLLVRSNNPVSSFSCKIEFKELVMNRMEFTAEPCLTMKILSTGERQTNIKYMITGNNW